MSAIAHPIPGKRRKYLIALINAGHKGLSCYEIVNILYGNCPNGGPLHVAQVVTNMKRSINAKLPRNVQIVTIGSSINVRHFIKVV